MKKLQTKRCPKCGKKIKVCQCKKSSRKFLRIMALILFSSCSLVWYSHGKNKPVSPEDLIANAKKGFTRALESLPDKEVQAHLLALTQKDDFVRYKLFNVPNPALYNTKQHVLGINAASNLWNTWPIETIWATLVHENQHILQDEKSGVSPIFLQTWRQKSEYTWNCEIDAMMAETLFAQKQGFFAQNYSEIAQIMSKENMDTKTAILVVAYPNLMRLEIYRPYWPYFPAIYNSQLPAQYRDKYGVANVN